MTLKLLAVLGLGLAAFWGATLWKAARNEALAEQRFPPEGRIIEVAFNGAETPVHYVQAGAGPDLVLIHGASGSTRDFTFGLVAAL